MKIKRECRRVEVTHVLSFDRALDMCNKQSARCGAGNRPRCVIYVHIVVVIVAVVFTIHTCVCIYVWPVCCG